MIRTRFVGGLPRACYTPQAFISMDCRVKPAMTAVEQLERCMRCSPANLCIALTLATLALGGCAQRGQIPVSSLGEDDDAICRANGVAAGSAAYVACRKDRDAVRSNAVARADRAQQNLAEYMLNHPAQ
jgi:hypothetical protein